MVRLRRSRQRRGRCRRRLPAPGPSGLAAYDAKGFKLVGDVYAGRHPLLAARVEEPTRLTPVELSAVSEAPCSDGAADEEEADEEEADEEGVAAEEVAAAATEAPRRALEIDNSSEEEVSVHWVDGDGVAHPYGQLRPARLLGLAPWRGGSVAGMSTEQASAGETSTSTSPEVRYTAQVAAAAYGERLAREQPGSSYNLEM